MSIACHIRQVGHGKEDARSIRHLQTCKPISGVLYGRVCDLALGTVVSAMQVTGESADELTAFPDATSKRCRLVVSPRPVVVLAAHGGSLSGQPGARQGLETGSLSHTAPLTTTLTPPRARLGHAAL